MAAVQLVVSITLWYSVRINNMDELPRLSVSQFTDLSNGENNNLYFMVVERNKLVKYLKHSEQYLTYREF